MRVYKTTLNSNNDLISYVMPNQIEDVYSIRSGTTYKIPYEDIYEYIELFGFLILPYAIPRDGIAYVSFLNIDYKVKPWEIDVGYIAEQVNSKIREKLLEEFFSEDDIETTTEQDENALYGIIGEDDIMLNESIYLSHKYKCGVWESNSDSILIDKNSGKIFGNKIGKATISYEVNTGYGMLTCFKTIEVKKYII
jgi:hypothetical protein